MGVRLERCCYCKRRNSATNNETVRMVGERVTAFHEIARTSPTFSTRAAAGLSSRRDVVAGELPRHPDAKRKESAPGFADGGGDLPAAESTSAVAHARNERQPRHFSGVRHSEPAANRSRLFRLGGLRRA